MSSLIRSRDLSRTIILGVIGVMILTGCAPDERSAVGTVTTTDRGSTPTISPAPTTTTTSAGPTPTTTTPTPAPTPSPEGNQSMTISEKMRAEVDQWTRKWADAQSINGIGYITEAGLSQSSPPLRIEGAGGSSVTLLVGCSSPRKDESGPLVHLGLTSFPDGAELDSRMVREGDVLEFNGWAIRIVGIGVTGRLVNVHLLAHPEPGPGSAAPQS